MTQVPFATPFTDVLCTNYTPSSEDKETIKTLLVAPLAQLTQFNDKISQLQHVLDSLKQERDVLDTAIKEHTRLLSPIHSVPDDVLRDIFCACLPDTHNAVMSCDEAPLILGLVCSRWRSVAYSTPLLWATLHIPLPSPISLPTDLNQPLIDHNLYDSRLEKHCTAIHNWLTRSGTCPLSISCIPANHSTAYDEARADQARCRRERYMKTILPFSHRRYRFELSISIRFEAINNALTLLSPASLPILTHLRLIFSPAITRAVDDGEGRAVHTLIQAPQLRILEIIPMAFSLRNVQRDWSRLSSIALVQSLHLPSPIGNFSTTEEVHYILTKCSNLSNRCTLYICNTSSEPAIQPTGSINLPYLRHLNIVEFSPLMNSSLRPLFECFSDISSLRSISYQNRQYVPHIKGESLISLLSHAGDQITHLCTTFNKYTTADLKTIFSLVPNLINLTENNPFNNALVYGTNVYPQVFSEDEDLIFFDVLTSSSGNTTILCPHLQSMEVINTAELDDARILSFIQRRMAAVHSHGIDPLRKFRATFKRPMEVDIRAALREYVDSGQLELNISYIPEQRYTEPQTFLDPRDGLMES
ncbi:hypothetical protein BDN70DRAFT_874282 [Pholiota conissans]|uniref:F-box domain-containing protein n=1 Tax=Pholiota conissans TaxID=109636 RepID=A0A9P5Z920_9AGAR|nr:hypothetical protein BDN70DRAFT_874282 [Pholiota conissans]